MSFYLMHRGWMDNDLFSGEAHTMRSAWVWLIENAAWEPTVVSIDRQPVPLARGELSFSERFLAQKWKWSRSRVHRFLSDLTTWGMIRVRNSPTQKSDNQRDRPQNILTICNYGRYQNTGTISIQQIEPSLNHLRTISEPKKKESNKDKEDLVPDGTRQSARQITEWMVEVWKEVFGEALSTPARHNENRIRTARARFVGDFRSDIGEWRKYLERIHRCPWLMGSKGWRADFDWVLKPANLTKVLEGRYDDRAANGSAQPGISFHRAPSGPPPTLEGWEVPMDRTH